MATPTYTQIATYTFTNSTTQTITFASIPSTFRDLVFSFGGARTGGVADENMHIRLNGDTGSNYYWLRMRADSGGYASDGGADSQIQIGRFKLNELSTANFSVMDYSATDKHKTVISRSASSDDWVVASVGRWADTSAVTSVTFRWGTTTNFTSGSVLSLYGIEA